MQEPIFIAFILTFLAGISTAVGGLLSFFIKKKNITALALGLSFSAGVMIYISFMEILPLAQDTLGAIMSEKKAMFVSTVIFFLGLLIAALIDFLIPDHVTQESFDKENNKLNRLGIFTAIALAIHNFPEGLVTFTSSVKDISLGIPIAIAIAIHNIPEGISVAMPIYNATGSRKKALFYATLSGLAEPLGAIVGFYTLSYFLNDMTFGVLFALTAGIMIYVSFDELLPMAKEYDKNHMGIVGVSLGMLVMATSLIFL